MFKNLLKFMGIALGIVILGAGVLYAIQYFRYRTSPEYQAVSYFKDLEKQYAEDPYGGETPEETLRLFIDALKKGDTELAAKYFVLDKQEQWREDLGRLQQKNLINEMVRDLDKAERGKDLNEDVARFMVSNENDEVITTINIAKGPNGGWKLLDF